MQSEQSNILKRAGLQPPSSDPSIGSYASPSAITAQCPDSQAGHARSFHDAIASEWRTNAVDGLSGPSDLSSLSGLGSLASKIFNEARNDSTCFPSLCIDGIKTLLGEIFLIQSHVGMTLSFCR